jgi:hypothetical protein
MLTEKPEIDSFTQFVVANESKLRQACQARPKETLMDLTQPRVSWNAGDTDMPLVRITILATNGQQGAAP